MDLDRPTVRMRDMKTTATTAAALSFVFLLAVASHAQADVGVESSSRAAGAPGDRVELTLGCGFCFPPCVGKPGHRHPAGDLHGACMLEGRREPPASFLIWLTPLRHSLEPLHVRCRGRRARPVPRGLPTCRHSSTWAARCRPRRHRWRVPRDPSLPPRLRLAREPTRPLQVRALLRRLRRRAARQLDRGQPRKPPAACACFRRARPLRRAAAGGGLGSPPVPPWRSSRSAPAPSVAARFRCCSSRWPYSLHGCAG